MRHVKTDYYFKYNYVEIPSKAKIMWVVKPLMQSRNVPLLNI